MSQIASRKAVLSMSIPEKEFEICQRFGSSVQTPEPDQKVGIALSTLSLKPLNALRHQPEGETCGWYIWGGKNDLKTQHFSNRCTFRIYQNIVCSYCRISLLPLGSEFYWHRIKRMLGMTHRCLIARSTLPTFYVSCFVQL